MDPDNPLDGRNPESGAIVIAMMSLAFVLAVGGFLIFTIRRKKAEAKRIAMLAKIRPASATYLEQFGQAPVEEPVAPLEMLEQVAPADPQQAADAEEFSGVFECDFGTSSHPEKVALVLQHHGKLRVTPASVFITARERGDDPLAGDAASFRLDPNRSRGYYDSERGILALCDSINPRRWLILRPTTTSDSGQDEFENLVGTLMALMGARLEERELKRFNAKAFWTTVISVLVTLAVIGAYAAYKLWRIKNAP